ncbi:cell division protein ZapE [Limimonas halophila]|uniref:Cell division protein ZapE n=1 Tax=Limimonas halophila TaxID=1082479 RepID=A0A1G7T1Z2_9PROT|nr:cell division protein ZapE [Limimonas halophila]SDG29347.1 cell division protein ZapE [Limimonas halophila]
MPDTPLSGVEEHAHGPLYAYRAMKRAGEVQHDPMQELAAEKLQSLHNALLHYAPTTGRKGLKERLGLGRRKQEPPQGLYIFGGVGRGKSMLMDVFHAHAPTEAKRRVHFYTFMAEVHERLHAWRQTAKAANKEDPLPEVAAEMAREAWLLCFDEFQVVNVADAMILGRLFEALFEQGAVVVATSNTPPNRLYEGGLQRERFTPFIELLRERMDVLELDGGVDYRLNQLRELSTYHTPLDSAARAAMDAAFRRLTEGATPEADRLTVKGRTITVPQAARGVARADFATLCEQPLGAQDYMALAARYHTLVLDDVPQLDDSRRDAARRFTALVDALYEHRCNLVVAADAEPHHLYTGHDGAEAFQRTSSRLMEMQARAYIDTAWLGGG